MSALTSSLVRDGVVPVRKIEEALQRQVISGGDVETVLLEMEAVPENVLAAYRAALYDLPPVARDQVMGVAPEVIKLVPAEVAREHRLIPLAIETRRSGSLLRVAKREPLTAEQEERLGFLLGFEIATHIACEVRIAAALAQFYGAELSPRFARLIDRLRTGDAGPAAAVTRLSAPPSLAPHGSDIPYKTKSDPASRAEHFEARTKPLGSVLEPIEARPRRDTARGIGVQSKKAPSERPVQKKPSHGSLKRARGPLTIPAGERMLKRASERDQILSVFFSFAQQFFDYTALFVVTEDIADGRDSWGIGASTDEVRAISINLLAPSVFAEVRRTHAPLVTRLESTEVDRDVATALRRATMPPALVMPIAIRQRVVLLLYGDRDGEMFDLGAVMELVRFSSRVVEAFEQLILRKKRVGYDSEAPGDVAERKQLKQAARSVASTAGTSRPDADRRRRDSGAWVKSKRSSPRFEAPVRAPEGDSWTAVAHKPVPLGRDAQPPPPIEPAASPRPTLRELDPNAPPSAVLGIPRNAPPPPPSAELDLDAVLPPVHSLPLDDVSLSVDDDDDDDDEPDLEVGDDDADDAPIDFYVEDEPEEARRPSNRPRPQGTYRVKGGPVDVVRPGAPRSPRPRARSPKGSDGDDEEGEGTPSSRPPSGLDADTRSVIVDMGEQVHAQVADLMAAGSPEREAQLLRGLLQLGETALPALVQAFPGQLAWDRHRDASKRPPPGRDLSIVARALVSFGERAVPYVASLLSSAHPDVRYYAGLVAAELIHPDLIEPIADRIYDEDPAVRRLACALLPRVAGYRGFDEVRVLIRRTARLRGKDLSRRWQAVDALTALRDVDIIEKLIDLIREDDPTLLEHVHRALVVLTCTDHGRSHRRWSAWYAKNGKRHRIEWLIDGLLNGEESIRQVAADELKRLTQEHYGYHAGSPKKDRERVHKRFRQWWDEEGQRRFA